MIVDLDHRLFLAQDYALINPMQVGTQAYADLNTICLQPKGLERHERLMPKLIHLAALESSQRIELLERSDQWAKHHDLPLFSALLSCKQPPAHLQSRLVARMVHRRGDGSRVWLRFHDPRVFQHLCWLLDDAQLATLMGPVATWTGYDPLLKQWWRQDRPRADISINMRLPAEHWLAIGLFEPLNRCLRDLVSDGVHIDPDIAKKLLDALVEGSARGLKAHADLILFARQWLAHGQCIVDSPEVAARLSSVREQRISYAAACADLKEEDLRPVPPAKSTW